MGSKIIYESVSGKPMFLKIIITIYITQLIQIFDIMRKKYLVSNNFFRQQ